MAIVRWSPVCANKFAVCRQDLRIYHYQEKDSEYSPDVNDISLSDTAYGHLIHLGKGYDSSKQRLAWAPLQDRPHVFAVSHTHGLVDLVNFGSDNETMHTLFNPRIKRTCTALEWNQTQSNYLAIGYKVDKSSRGEGSLFVVNMNETSGGATHLQPGSSGGHVGSMESSTSKVVLEQGGEGVSSICWLPWEPNLVAASMGKAIRIYDIRDEIKNQRPSAASATLKVSGLELSADPFSTYRLSTYTKDHAGVGVTFWDTRQLSRPIFSIFRNTSSTIAKIEWSPTQSGRLALLTIAPPTLQISNIPTGLDEWHEVDGTEFNMRTRNCHWAGQTVDINWHWKWYNSLLSINSAGDVKAVTVMEPSPLSWDPHNGLARVTTEGILRETFKSGEKSGQRDISVVMKERAVKGYGFDAKKNATIVEEDKELLNLWTWLDQMQHLLLNGRVPSDRHQPLSRSQSRSTVPGVVPVLTGEFSGRGTCSKAQATTLRQHTGNVFSEVPSFVIYDSIERNQCLLMCGWDMREEGLESFFKREEMNDRHERAAALSVFNGYIGHSIRSLKYSANITAQQGQAQRSTMLTMAALALAGYSSRGTDLWQKTCKELKDTLKEPYLRAMFSYLSSKDSKDFLAILEDDRITYQDRVAFAIMYLDQTKLMPYLESLKTRLTGQGNLKGLFLTGINEDGLKLLSKYIDKTSDVQTACMVVGQASGFISKEQQATGWFKCYRELLNKWRLWHNRVSLDITQKERDASKAVSNQVFLSCNYCGKSINSPGVLSSINAGQRKKVTSCPQCRKPLPRCAICLMYMGVGASSVYNYKTSTGETPKSSFDHWFTWCQTCRHGGHAAHILEWFKSHTECPVSKCHCRCVSMDGKGEQDLSSIST